MEDLFQTAVLWLSFRLKSVTGYAGDLVDAGLKRLLDRLYGLATTRNTNGINALETLASEIEDGKDNPWTRKHVELTLQEAADKDSDFAHELERLVTEIESLCRDSPRPHVGRDSFQQHGDGIMIIHTGSGSQRVKRVIE